MGQFSKLSQERLATCHPQLIRLANIVVLTFDIVVVCGFRNEEEQTKALKEGKSHLGWPHSKHNKSLPDGMPCSEAFDLAPFNSKEEPIDWADAKRFILLGGYVLGVAEIIGIPIRWGGDWDNDTFMNDQRLHDLPHFELNL